MKIIDNIKRIYDKATKKGWSDLFSTFSSGSGSSRLSKGNPKDMIATYESWVYACASKNAQTLAKHSVGLYRWKKDGNDWISDEVMDHPFLNLMKNVNPYMNEYELKEITSIFQDLTGNAYWYVAKNRFGIPAEIWVLPSHKMKIIPSASNFISHYEMHDGGRVTKFDVNEIIQFKLPNPFNPYYGLSRIQASAYAVESNQFQKRYELALFQNQARPDGILSTDKPMNPNTIKLIKDQWQSKHQGVENAGSTAVLDNGLKYQQIGISPRELDFMMSREMTREEICAIFGTPLAKLGIVKDVNRANAEALNASYIEETIEPVAIRLQEKLTEKLAPMFGDENLHMRFKNLSITDKEFMLKERESNIRSYVTTINEERIAMGKDPIEGGDKPLVPIGLIALGEEFDFQLDSTGKTIKAVKKSTEDAPQATEKKEAVSKAGKDKGEKNWLQFLAVTTSQERIFTKAMQGYFAKQRERVKANLASLKKFTMNKSLVDSILFPIGEEDERLKELSFQYIHASTEAGVLLGATKLGLDEVNFDLLNPNIITAVRSKSIKITRVNATTFKELREHLIQGISEGESIPQLAKRIDDVYDFSEKHRSAMIARTETVGAVNNGEVLMYREAGIKKKRWLSARDENTRTSHRGAESQVIGIDEAFVLSGDHGVSELKYPADPEGPAHEVINCRCTLLPVTEEEN